ncbi:NAD-dependent deacylase [Pedobacter sp. P351]|uniref:SIR2 family NAD-dependent protein deacylase n=1 Tax=Pedobacter superstes TaxID=3133441 RepID=UPI0030A1541A
MKPKLIILTGAGISAESGLKTFRDSDGLWEGYDIYDVATPEAWQRNPVLVQDFYNMRRKSVLESKPNAAHLGLIRLEDKYDVSIITQNVDDLHERAGSSNVLHLHGIITKSQSSINADLVYDIEGWELKMGEICELGSQLRPHVVWFGEAVPMFDMAMQIASGADIFLIIGTSLAVYPAASLIDYVPYSSQKIIIDPNTAYIRNINNLRVINDNAGTVVPKLVDELLSEC